MNTLEQLRNGQLSGAREIKIADGLNEFPRDIFALADTLEVLDLSGNALSALPDDFARLHKLRIFFASNNAFTEVPEVLGQCPALSMVGFKANRIRHLSGQALPAQLHTPQGPRPVAVKLFKGAVTSDGWPHTEMAASLRAGTHPQLIPALGQITGHPAGTQGLVMPLIDPVMRNLAGPPSMASCTRDIYAETTRFTLAAALQLAHGIASAARHLHQQGVMHGDLYAHNILHDGQGQALLGDFGAGWLLDSTDPSTALSLQQLEVRAFGCLLEELLDRCDAQDRSHAALAGLQDLKQQCLCETPPDRPRFEAIEDWIATLRSR
ncbi:leucine-rich repeat-containing protein kinase family protein [Limnohabitans sp. Jir72]|uniref:leucine-rich repeat-containing protein kinase family protein n=1 Tax=Limnohabitans sp. Jir72 TaxID=1977909 RepID=UPI000D3AAFFB|nr:protein kinase [Limnohabitans sp. Jir72]PUE34234.1 hypothetical protein B9Z52_04770 [Limnohabitans sp. Jir72]